MLEYKFHLTRIFPYKYRIVDYVLMRENMSQRKPVLWHILQSATRDVVGKIPKIEILKITAND